MSLQVQSHVVQVTVLMIKVQVDGRRAPSLWVTVRDGEFSCLDGCVIHGGPLRNNDFVVGDGDERSTGSLEPNRHKSRTRLSLA